MSKLLLIITSFWFGFVCLHETLTGNTWYWVIPGIAPPLVFTIIPVIIIIVTLCVNCRKTPVLILSFIAFIVSIPSTGINFSSLLFEEIKNNENKKIKIIQMNTDYWGQLRDGTLTDPRNKHAMLAFLKDLDADIYLLQEHMSRIGNTAPPITDLTDIKEIFPEYSYVTAGTLLTLSRHPVINHYSIETKSPTILKLPPPPYILRTDISIGDNIISTYNIHMPIQIIIEKNWFSKDFYNEIKKRYYIRKNEYKSLVNDINENIYPLVIAGDFNTSPVMGDNRQLLKITEDAANYSSIFYPTTWRVGGQLPKLWRNDWFLLKNNVKVNSYKQLDPEGNSDHSVQYVDIFVNIE